MFVSLLIGLGLAGCAGSSESPAVVAGPVASYFDTEIEPILAAKCSSCHVPAPASHATYPDKNGACYLCHDGDGPGVMPTVRAYPPLTPEEEVAFAVARGTLVSWIQPGGV